jgi:hypothetical protein
VVLNNPQPPPSEGGDQTHGVLPVSGRALEGWGQWPQLTLTRVYTPTLTPSSPSLSHHASLTVSPTVSLTVPPSPSLSLCLSLCLPHRLSHCVSHRASLTVSPTVSLTVSPSPSLSLCLSPCLPHRLSHCVSHHASLTVSPTASLTVSPSPSLPLCLSPCLPHRLPLCLSPCLPHRLSHCVSHRVSLTVSLTPPSDGPCRQFVCGGRGGQLILNSKGWLGNRDHVLHSGEGAVHAVRWRGSLIAWANDAGVKVSHTAMKKLRIVVLGFDTARQKLVLERWTNLKPFGLIVDRAAI